MAVNFLPKEKRLKEIILKKTSFQASSYQCEMFWEGDETCSLTEASKFIGQTGKRGSLSNDYILAAWLSLPLKIQHWGYT